jgi:hypothetical protein
MSEFENEQDAVPGNPALAATETEEASSLLEGLRQRRSELSETKEVLIPLPGYDREPPILMAKYRLLEGHEIDAIGRKVVRETKDRWDRQIIAAVDTFINACEGMYISMGNGKEPEPLTMNGDPVAGYNQDLARALKFDADTAREVVMGVFAGNDVAIMQHNVRLSLWMGDTTRRIDEDFLGET